MSGTERIIGYSSSANESIATYNGHKVGAVWGPAVEGDWFAALYGHDPVRVPTREDAEARLFELLTMPLPAELHTPAGKCACFRQYAGGDVYREVPCPDHGGKTLTLPAPVK